MMDCIAAVDAESHATASGKNWYYTWYLKTGIKMFESAQQDWYNNISVFQLWRASQQW